jgi:hypothetical protein
MSMGGGGGNRTNLRVFLLSGARAEAAEKLIAQIRDEKIKKFDKRNFKSKRARFLSVYELMIYRMEPKTYATKSCNTIPLRSSNSL